jgi:hypothetical protein
MLERICRAAIAHYGDGGGLLIDYRELADTALPRLLDHFGLRYGADELACMRATARFDAKRPGQPYADDSAAKRRDASAEIRELAATVLAPVNAELETLRRRSTS